MTTTKQIKAIVISKKLGDRLARKHPEIAEEYRAGKTAPELTERYLPVSLTSKTSQTTRNIIIYNALNNLLSSEEKKRLGKEHLLAASSKRGLECKLNKTGIFSQTEEESNIARRNGVLARGYIPYDTTKETEYGCITEKQYIVTLKQKGLSYQEIVQKTNDLFDNNRKVNRVRKLFARK